MDLSLFPIADQAAVSRHLAFLQAEAAAVSLNATLPESGIAVIVHKNGRVERAVPLT